MIKIFFQKAISAKRTHWLFLVAIAVGNNHKNILDMPGCNLVIRWIDLGTTCLSIHVSNLSWSLLNRPKFQPSMAGLRKDLAIKQCTFYRQCELEQQCHIKMNIHTVYIGWSDMQMSWFFLIYFFFFPYMTCLKCQTFFHTKSLQHILKSHSATTWENQLILTCYQPFGFQFSVSIFSLLTISLKCSVFDVDRLGSYLLR